MAQFAARADAFRPLHDERRRDAALVNPTTRRLIDKIDFRHGEDQPTRVPGLVLPPKVLAQADSVIDS